MSKFALLVARSQEYEADVKRDVVQEAFEALRTLGHSDADARKLLDGVLKTKRKFSDVEAVLQAIYQQSHGRPEAKLPRGHRPQAMRLQPGELPSRHLIRPLARHVAAAQSLRTPCAALARRGWR